MSVYDVAVVGAGPSGSFLAYLLAQRGLSVLMIDKAVFPRDKVCGGGLSQKTMDLLGFDLSPIVERRIRGAYLTYQNRDTVVKDLGDRGGCCVLRRDFDNFILQKARSAGVEFLSDCAFTHAERKGDLAELATSRGTFRARYLVGADGVFSQVRRRLFGPRLVTYAPAVEALVYVPQRVIDDYEDRVLFDFGGMPRGYGWIFPKRDHLNVGVFSVFRCESIKSEMNAFMARYRSFREPLRVQDLGFAIPLRNTRRIFQKGNVWLIGDAAGFAESFYGEGIYFGLKSSVVAADAMTESFDAPGSLLYAQRVKKDLLPDLTYSELNAKLFFSNQRLGFDRMVRNVHVNDDFGELIAGRVGHRECFFRTLLTLPYWVFSRRIPPLTDKGF